MGFTEAVRTCFQKYFTFSGRARRSEFWYWTLFTIIASLILSAIDTAAFSTDYADTGPLDGVFSLVTFIPALAVTWRRLHDTGRSGWFYGGAIIAVFVIAIFIGAAMFGTGMGDDNLPMVIIFIIAGIAALVWFIALLVFLCQDSDHGPNKYGPSPKYGGADIFD